MWYIAKEDNFDHIEHHGILGQKWGIRRYQNPDGSLTPEGRLRYGSQENYEKALKKHDQRVRIAKGAAIGAAAGLAIYGGARYLRKQKAIRNSLLNGLSQQEINSLIPGYNKYAKALTYDQLKDVQTKMFNVERNSNFTKPKAKLLYDAVTREMANRDAISKAFNGEGEKAIKNLIGTFNDRATSEFAKTFGTAIGAAGVGMLVATFKQMTDGGQRSDEDRAREYANYMWQNPNKK